MDVNVKERIIEEFGNRLRVRVSGICIEDEKILLVNHHSLNEQGDFWGPPGGGMDFGISAEENLKREFLEETGLDIEVNDFLFVHEYLSPPLHAIELVYRVYTIGGNVSVGTDPEMNSEEQIIKDVRFMNYSEVRGLDSDKLHQMFLHIKYMEEIKNLKGYFIWKGKK